MPIHVRVESDGFEGVFYQGRDSDKKALIVMSGSNGGLSLTRKEAEFYRNNGISALALALFRTQDTPKELSRIPIEYVESAIRWLRGQGYEKIGIDGMSKGSEMALLAASMFSEISCVIARVPSYFVSEGIAGAGKSRRPSGTSCWSYQGRDIPYAPYQSRKFSVMKAFLREWEVHIIDFNRDKEVRPDTIIPVDRIKGPVLLISSKHDEIWPSYESACRIERELREKAFTYPVRHVALDYISHAVTAMDLPGIYKLIFRTERQHPKECRRDREILRGELLFWVNEVWK